MDKPILSIIVPVYNVEKFIKECIESLIKQSLKSVEIIVVDDGSLDNSINIVNSFSCEKIKVIHKENGGLSSARNAGIKVATGKYIAFVDSDDFISSSTAYEDIVNLLEKNNGDIAVGKGSWYYNENKIIPMNKDNSIFMKEQLSNEEYLIESIKQKRIFVPVWLNIVKASLIIDNELYFTEGILHEDELFSPQLFLKAKKVILYNKEFYMYRQREGSIMNSKNNRSKRLQDSIYICEELSKVSRTIENNKLKEEFKNYIAYLGLCSIYNVKGKMPKVIKALIKENSSRKSLRRSAFFLNINENLYYGYEFIKRKLWKFVNK